MKPPLVLGSIVAGMVLVGAAGVGATYLVLHPASSPPGRQPVAESSLPQLSAPPGGAVSQAPERLAQQVRHARRLCPAPTVYHHRAPRRARLTPIRWAQPAYEPPAVYAEPAPPPPPPGWYARPAWRVGWRGPGWRYPPHGGFGPPPGYGPVWRRPWRDW